MAAKSSLARQRRLSLDIVAESKATDERVKVWTFHNSQKPNEAFHQPSLNNDSTSSTDKKLPLYARRRSRANGIKKNKVSARKEQTNWQVKLTASQKYLSWRFCMVLLLQSSFIVVIFIRNCLPMAIVCMVKPRTSASGSNMSEAVTEAKSRNVLLVSANMSQYNISKHEEEPVYEFDWSSEVQGVVLTSIMFSSFIGPLLVTAVKEKIGNKLSLTIFSMISALLTFLSPVAARINPYCLVALRVLLGISVGSNTPVVGDCLAWWAPQDETLTMVTSVFTGVNIGSILASGLSGYLCLVPLDNGWPFVFYAFGSISLIWCAFWYFLSSEKPEDHPYISEKEKEYIVSHRTGLSQPTGGEKTKPPYRKMLTSFPIIAYFASTTCHIWSTQLLFTYLPVYFYKVLKFSVQQTGLLVSLTSSFRMFGSIMWTVIGNKLVSVVSTNKSRKICICSGFAMGGVTAIIVSFFDDNYKWLVLGLLVVLMVAQSVGSSTISALPLDMAPRYAGLLTGICISFGSLVGISGPMLTAAITKEGTHEEWRIVWILIGCVFSCGFIIFLSFGHASLQPWAVGADAQLPHIISPFVTMGRRFSAFLEAPPVSPVSPEDRGKGFDFSTSNMTTPNVISQLVTATPDIFFAGNVDFRKHMVQEIVLDPTPEESEDTDSNRADEDIQPEEDKNEQINKIRIRAFSEYGLEVLPKNVGKDNINADFEQDTERQFVWSSKENHLDHTEVETSYIAMDGVVNEAYDETESGNVPDSNGVDISRL